MNLFTRLILAILCGAAYAADFEPQGTRGWLTVPAICGLLMLLRGLNAHRARAFGFVWGMAAYGIGLSWFWLLFHWLAIGLFAILALFIALFAWMQNRAENKAITGWKWILFTAVNWSACEFIRSELFPLKFPWMTAGLAIGPSALLSWIGVYGVGFFLVIAAALISTWRSRNILAGVLVMIVLLLSRYSIPIAVDESRSIHAAAVQNEAVTLAEYLKQSQNLPAGQQHIVWPEYSLSYDVRNNKQEMKLLQEFCEKEKVTLTVGATTPAPNRKAPYNTALTMDGTGVLGMHHKVHPVHFFNDGTPGPTSAAIQTSNGKIGTPICFDCDYEGVVRQMTADGAEYFLVPSMDVSSWGERQHRQHSALFRIRACENGRWMLVAASSGVSQLIDPHGVVHTSIEPLTVGELTGVLNRESHLTFYTRAGWMIPWIVLSLSIIFWIALLLPTRKQSQTA